MWEMVLAGVVWLVCLVVLKPLCDRTTKNNFRYIPVATLLFGAMILLVMSIGVGGKMGIAYGVMCIFYFIGCFGSYMYVQTRAS